MTDKKTDTSQDERARSQSAVLTTPASKRVPPQGDADGAGGKHAARKRGTLAPVALVVALAAIGLSAVVWQQHRQLQQEQADLSSQLAGAESAAGRSASQIQGVSQQLQRQEEQIALMQSQLNEAAAVIRDLDEALRSMTDRGSELVLLNDVDHLVTIAQQQLQLGGNVRNAIVALESAQAQLARANRPALASLLQTVNGDLDRLRAASTIDIAAFSSQLEELAVLLTEAPLIMPETSSGNSTDSEATEPVREQPAPTIPYSGDARQTWWEEAWDATRDWSRDTWRSLRSDLGQFIEVRRVDDASALLMSPDQATRFRDNLRTRVMTAQLALMMRQAEVWRTETEAIVKAIETRYDESSPMTRKALRMARNMADASIDARLPTVDNTLQALAALREEQSRSFGGASTPEAADSSDPAEAATSADDPASSADGSADPVDGAADPADGAAEAAEPTDAPAGEADKAEERVES